ncbi:MAG: hypothetical protein D6721_06200 [Gammaproteobacteria bacterium]|nr:MAG: hypothetical protein D6721_06200 [Gammaproteobacteria bacterium]
MTSRLFVWLCLAALAIPPGLAAEVYDIELLVFARTTPDDGEEYWPDDPGRPAALAQALDPAVAPGVEPLPASAWRLQALAAALDRAPGYRVLLHRAWRESLPPGMQGPWLRLRIPADASLPVTAPPPESPTEGDAWTAVTGNGRATPRLDGVVRLSRARYLHLDADLLYTEAVPFTAPETEEVPRLPSQVGPAAAEAPAGAAVLPAPGNAERTVRLHQHRRMRSGEIHYLDHPRLGLLVLATPYEPPAEAPASEEANTPGKAASPENTGTTAPIPRSE